MTDEIIKYIEGELSEAEILLFEKKMTNDKALIKRVELFKDVDTFLENEAEFEELRERVIQIHDNYEKENISKIRKIKYLKWSAAASIILVIGTIWFLMLSTNSTNAFYNKNFTAWQPKNVTRGANTNMALIKWVGLYTNEDYYIVIENYIKLPETYLNDPQIVLMYSCALMKQNKFEKAVEVLNAANVTNSTLFSIEYNWYKGLCYLKLDDVDKAQNLFKSLVGNKKYGESASVILSKFEE